MPLQLSQTEGPATAPATATTPPKSVGSPPSLTSRTRLAHTSQTYRRPGLSHLVSATHILRRSPVRPPIHPLVATSNSSYSLLGCCTPTCPARYVLVGRPQTFRENCEKARHSCLSKYPPPRDAPSRHASPSSLFSFSALSPIERSICTQREKKPDAGNPSNNRILPFKTYISRTTAGSTITSKERKPRNVLAICHWGLLLLLLRLPDYRGVASFFI